MKGRKPKPRSLKIVEGTLRPDRDNPNAPKPRPIAPAVPPDLDDAAKTAWSDLAPKLERLGLLTEVDGETFGMLCRALARYQEATKRLKAILDKLGKDPVKHLKTIRQAEVSVEKSEHSYRLLASEFGLSPASRTRLNVPTQQEEDEFESFLIKQA